MWAVDRMRPYAIEYTCVYLYITRVAFPGPRARRLQIPRGASSAKSDLLSGQVSEASSVRLRRPQRKVLERVLEASWPSFCGISQRVLAACEKEFRRLVSWSEDERSSIAKLCKP